MSAEQLVDVYYAHLLMDAGCTAWTSQLAGFILSDEIAARRDSVFYRNMRDPVEMFGWLREHVAAGTSARTRVQRGLEVALHRPEFVREGFRNTCEVAQRFASRMGMSDPVQHALLSVFEQWDGSGPKGRSGEAIPIRLPFQASGAGSRRRVVGRVSSRSMAAVGPGQRDACIADSPDASAGLPRHQFLVGLGCPCSLIVSWINH